MRAKLRPWVFGLFLFVACSPAMRYGRPDAMDGDTQTGLASYYGPQYHGRTTANGETFDMYGISAAHRTLPFGTWVRVKHRDTGRQVDVRINDRGPFIAGRIIDLSYGAARKLGMVEEGVAPVRIKILDVPDVS